MTTSTISAIVAALCLTACSGVVQPGLANAPVLGGATPETRVHDVIANGHDSCERSMFPQGGVLRGQVPPCRSEGPNAALVFAALPR